MNVDMDEEEMEYRNSINPKCSRPVRCFKASNAIIADKNETKRGENRKSANLLPSAKRVKSPEVVVLYDGYEQSKENDRPNKSQYDAMVRQNGNEKPTEKVDRSDNLDFHPKYPVAEVDLVDQQIALRKKGLGLSISNKMKNSIVCEPAVDSDDDENVANNKNRNGKRALPKLSQFETAKSKRALFESKTETERNATSPAVVGSSESSNNAGHGKSKVGKITPPLATSTPFSFKDLEPPSLFGDFRKGMNSFVEKLDIIESKVTTAKETKLTIMANFVKDFEEQQKILSDSVQELTTLRSEIGGFFDQLRQKADLHKDRVISKLAKKSAISELNELHERNMAALKGNFMKILKDLAND